MGIRFEVNESGRPYYILDDPRWAMLGSWLATDVRNSRHSALDALAIVDDVVSGRSVREVFEGVIYDVDVRRTTVRVCHSRSTEYVREYDLHDVRAAVERYWVFMRVLPGRDTRNRALSIDLAVWERSRRRTHPYRGRLGLPPDTGA